METPGPSTSKTHLKKTDPIFGWIPTPSLRMPLGLAEALWNLISGYSPVTSTILRLSGVLQCHWLCGYILNRDLQVESLQGSHHNQSVLPVVKELTVKIVAWEKYFRRSQIQLYNQHSYFMQIRRHSLTPPVRTDHPAPLLRESICLPKFRIVIHSHWNSASPHIRPVINL